MNIKALFEQGEDGKLSYDEFEAHVKEAGLKLADLSDGKYVSKSKYDKDIEDYTRQVETLNAQVETLNGTITTRDEDLANLQDQLKQAGEDKTKLAQLSEDMSTLQAKYDADMKAGEEKLRQQSYNFAVTRYADTQQFTSKAAKRDFIKAMLDKNLEMEGEQLVGADDFRQAYATENEDAFYTEPEPAPAPETTPEPAPEPAPEPTEPSAPIPTFVASTSGAPSADEDAFDFGFTGVRAHG